MEPAGTQLLFFWRQINFMAGYWLKLYTEILDDPKYNRLSDTAKLGMIELLVVAKRVEMDGVLPSMQDICFYTRRQEEWWKPVIAELVEINFIVVVEGKNVIRKFSERQDAVKDTERQRMYREKKNAAEYYHNDNVTNVSRNVTESREEEESEKEVEVETERDSSTAPALVGYDHQETSDERFAEDVYRTVTGNISMPPSIRAPATEMILDLRVKHPEKVALVEYLRPFFDKWRGTRGKSGKFYSALSTGWIEWALAGETLHGDSETLSGRNYTTGKYAEFCTH